jgi:hypothetical protein
MFKKILLLTSLSAFIASSCFTQVEQENVSPDTQARQELWFPGTIKDFFYYYLPETLAVQAALVPLMEPIWDYAAYEERNLKAKEVAAILLLQAALKQIVRDVATSVGAPTYDFIALPGNFVLSVIGDAIRYAFKPNIVTEPVTRLASRLLTIGEIIDYIQSFRKTDQVPEQVSQTELEQVSLPNDTSETYA